MPALGIPPLSFRDEVEVPGREAVDAEYGDGAFWSGAPNAHSAPHAKLVLAEMRDDLEVWRMVKTGWSVAEMYMDYAASLMGRFEISTSAALPRCSAELARV